MSTGAIQIIGTRGGSESSTSREIGVLGRLLADLLDKSDQFSRPARFLAKHDVEPFIFTLCLGHAADDNYRNSGIQAAYATNELHSTDIRHEVVGHDSTKRFSRFGLQSDQSVISARRGCYIEPGTTQDGFTNPQLEGIIVDQDDLALAGFRADVDGGKGHSETFYRIRASGRGKRHPDQSRFNSRRTPTKALDYLALGPDPVFHISTVLSAALFVDFVRTLADGVL